MISVDMFRSCKHLVVVVLIVVVVVIVVVVALLVRVIAVQYLFFPYALPLASAGVGGFQEFYVLMWSHRARAMVRRRAELTG
jgi:uncharacterized membrane protein